MNIQDLIKIKIDNKYIFEAKDVANFHNVSLNAVYNSRNSNKRGLDKLDKLMAFEKIKEIIEEPVEENISLSGHKDNIIQALNHLLQDEKRYKVNYDEID
jgi:hypothetical protein